MPGLPAMTDRALGLAPSSNVASASYDDEKMELTVVFYSGTTTVYQGVNKEAAAGLEGAPSPGGYVHRFLKGRFPST